AIHAQEKMASIQGVAGVSFAGAYLRYGFHEDGFTSGLKAAAALPSVRPPFEITYAKKKEVPQTTGEVILAELFNLDDLFGRWRVARSYSILFLTALEMLVWGGFSWLKCFL
ncbi:hypothetical protein H0H93_015147, partial [Arthromyces matolae]